MSIFEQSRNQYGDYYRTEQSDSPKGSRTSLLCRLRDFIGNGIQSERGMLLDLGSGPQILESEYRSVSPKPLPYTIITVDNATIPRKRLLVQGRQHKKTFIPPPVYHINADSVHLPFAHETFQIAISNMALDFMPRETIDELYRVMQPNAHIFLNLHHPDLIYGELSKFEPRFNELQPSQQETVLFWRYLVDQQMLYHSEDECLNVFQERGFQINHIRQNQEGYMTNDKWWEIDMVRT